MHPELREVLKGLEETSPNKKIQKAMTPKLLRYMVHMTATVVVNDPVDHATDLIVGAFFFAMRSCEYVWSSRKGRTKMITLGGIKFLDSSRQVLDHDDPHLAELAVYVWIRFEYQKNGEKDESRTQRKSSHPLLCPVLRFVRVVQRVRRFVPDISNETPLCSVNSTQHRSDFVSQTFTRSLMKKICKRFGGKETFGFDEDEIGNRSIRSGAAMALFLQNHSSDKIMILGRWKSKAWLDYIRPQVLEWTDLFSSDMISFDNFYELCSGQRRTVRNNKQRKTETMNDLEIPDLVGESEY
jgi:hypothetical protein